MRGILVNPWLNRVIEVYVEPGIEGIYKTLSYKDWKVTTFSCPIVIESMNTMFLDEESLFKSGVKSFSWNGYPDPLFGNALILGHTLEGDSCDSDLSLDHVEEMVSISSYITTGRL